MLTENIVDIVFIVDRQGVLTYISDSVESALGYTVRERLGTSFFEAAHADDRDALTAAMNTFAGSARLERANFRFIHKNGAVRVLHLHGTNLLHHAQIRGLVINATDVTGRDRLEKELEQLKRLASLGRFGAQMAHEFNNVMMGIQPFVDVIKRRPADPQLTRLADMMATSLARGKRLTSEVLRFGRPLQLSLRPVDVYEVLNAATEVIRPLLPEGTTLAVDVAESPLAVQADSRQLSQVIVNLALNARDAMHGRNGSLTIGARRAENDLGYVHINVSDTGEGIKPEDLPNIFEPLFTTRKAGIGLGLSVVYQVIAGHSGHIFVETERGQGTTVHLLVPEASPLL